MSKKDFPNPLRKLSAEQLVAFLAQGQKSIETFNKMRTLDPDWRPCLACVHLGNGDDFQVNLQGLDLSNCNMGEVSFTGEDLRNTPFRESYLYLTECNLCGVDLTKTDLRWTRLMKADLSGAYLSGANLVGANLNDANLCGADLASAATECVN